MGHYRADMYDTEEQFANRHKREPSSPEKQAKFRKDILKAITKKSRKNKPK